VLLPGALDLDLDPVLEQFRNHGWARLGRVLDPAYAARLRERADDVMLGRVPNGDFFFQHDSPTGTYDGLAFGEGWTGPSLAYRKVEKMERDPDFRAWIENALFARLARRVLGERVSLYRAVLWTKAARGGTDLPWHQDGGRFWGLDRDPQLQLWTALDDAPLDAGCVEVAPGTHHAGLVGPDGGGVPEEAVERVKPVSLPLPASTGEVLLLHNFVWHRSARNATPHPRRALSVSLLDGDTRCTRKKHKPREFLRLFGT